VTDSTRTDTLLASVVEGFITIDARGAVESVNPAGERLFGYSEEELVGRPFSELLGDPYRAEYADRIAEMNSEDGSPLLGATRSAFGRRRDGSSFPIELTITGMRPEGERLLVAVVRDVSDQRRAEQMKREHAGRDSLTGLLNRSAFEEDLGAYSTHSARYGTGGSVLVLDVDELARHNDAVGRKSADELLRQLAAAIKGRLRETDLVARLDGGEFACLLHGASAETAAKVAEDVRAIVAARGFAVGGETVRVTVSGGVAPLGEADTTASELLDDARGALQDAKDRGRDAVARFIPPEPAGEADTADWARQLEASLESGRFAVAAQPVVNLAGNGVVDQYELLIRMRGEGDALIGPSGFLPMAERLGHAAILDRWMIRQAADLVQVLGGGEPVSLELNLSASSAKDPDLPLEIGREVLRTGIDPSSLIFEISETAAFADVDQAARLAEAITQIGCRFALDNFGTGFASFNQLRSLPVSLVKIDGEHVRAAANDPESRMLVRVIAEVASGLGIKTVAEHVEDEETLDLVRELGVDYAQGFHLGAPEPVSAS
jgi:diguanylate cyclase (GGDEF)-like protein/PAS domain S-box-containing protein